MAQAPTSTPFSLGLTIAVIAAAWLLAPARGVSQGLEDSLQPLPPHVEEVFTLDESPASESQSNSSLADRESSPKPPENVQDLAKRLAEVEAKLKKQEEVEEEKASQAAAKEAAETACPPLDEKWTVKFGGHVQFDYINWAGASSSIPPTEAQDYFEFRRLRLVADGSGYGECDFRLQMTLEPEAVADSPAMGSDTSPDVKDAYFSMNEIPFLGRFRIGNFFVPFSLEQVTNDTNNIFLERSIPTQGVFAADREVGIAFYNCTPEEDVTWTYGAFFDSISEGLKERIDDNQGYRLVGRLTCLPYDDESSNGRRLVHVGCGILFTGDQNDSVRFRARPQVHEGPRLIDTGALSATSYVTANAEGAVVWGRFAVQGEAFLSHVNEIGNAESTFNGAYLHGSWFLTGESRIFDRFGQHGAQFARNVPNNNFRLARDGSTWGAWEAKARWSRLDLSQANAGQYNDLTLGFNWFWSDRTRVMFDWIHPMTSAATVFGESQADLLAMRFDFNW